MTKLFAFCASLAAVVATPAVAQNIGDFGAANFSYGTLTATGFSDYMRYAAGSAECRQFGDCARGGDTFALIAATGTPGSLLVHPGPGIGGNSAVGYTIQNAGFYNLNALATSADSGNKTVGYYLLRGGVLTTFASGSIGGSGQQAITAGQRLGVGDMFGIFVNNGDGNYNNDSTLVSGSIAAAVPEPATWGMMILGFGLIGGLMRSAKRRSDARFDLRIKRIAAGLEA